MSIAETSRSEVIESLKKAFKAEAGICNASEREIMIALSGLAAEHLANKGCDVTTVEFDYFNIRIELNLKGSKEDWITNDRQKFLELK